MWECLYWLYGSEEWNEVVVRVGGLHKFQVTNAEEHVCAWGGITATGCAGGKGKLIGIDAHV